MSTPPTDPAHGDDALAALRALKRRHCYMFAGANTAYDFYRGWLPDLIVACDSIDRLLGEDKRRFRFTQVKEKLGWARYYWRTEETRPLRLSLFTPDGLLERQHGLENADAAAHEIAQILLTAEASSRRKCIVCAAPAETRSFGGWLVCSCERHGPEVMARDDLLHACLLRDAIE